MTPLPPILSLLSPISPLSPPPSPVPLLPITHRLSRSPAIKTVLRTQSEAS